MKPTVELEILDEHAGPVVARHVCAAVAVRVGLGPLAADRIGTRIEHAMRAVGCPIHLAVSVDASEAVIAFTAESSGWQTAAMAALGGTLASRTHSAVELRLRRPPLALVEG